MMNNNKGFSTAFTDPRKALLTFESHGLSEKLFQVFHEYLKEKMAFETREQALEIQKNPTPSQQQAFQDAMTVMLEASLNVTAHHLMTMLHSGANITTGMMNEMFRDLVNQIDGHVCDDHGPKPLHC